MGALQTIERDGFAVFEKVIEPLTVDALVEAFDAQSQYAMRNVFEVVPITQQLLDSARVIALINELLGERAFAVRSVFFDKIPGRNWPVAWHQDQTIAVKHRIEAPGFGPWSVKSGVPCVRPPVSVLEKMVTLRFHLDDCDAKNGALRVVPGSHHRGFIDPNEIPVLRDQLGTKTCEVQASGVVVMKPLVLHASSPAKAPTHRRVIHVEFAANALPDGLEWSQQFHIGL